MNPFENINNPQEGQQNSPSCISELRNNIHGMIQDSRLTADEAQEINYQLSSSIDNCRAETHQEIQQSAREILKNGINIRAGEDSERRIWSYLGTDLMGIRNILLQQWIQVPDNYSIRDNEDYLVFHDENGKDIGRTIGKATKYEVDEFLYEMTIEEIIWKPETSLIVLI